MDAILGLIPGAGDLSGALVGAYGILVARSLGAPTSIQLRMLMNLALDAVVGAIPVVGDLFDFAFKAHVRNRVLLEKWLARPRETRRSSAAALLAVLLALLGVMVATIWIATLVLRWLYAQCCGQLA
jgi:hypothetical protein